MTSRTAARVAWLGLGFGLLSTAIGEGLSAAEGFGVDWFSVAMLSFAVVGALVVSRHPGNGVGWVMVGIGLLLGISEALGAYVVYAVHISPGSLPAPEIALGLDAPMWVPAIGLPGTFLILLFPDGRLPSAGWRGWARFTALAMVVAYLVIFIQPYGFADAGFPGISNPFGIEAIPETVHGALLTVVLLIPIAIGGCAVALIKRFRRSQGRTRLQLKWLAASGGIVAAIYGVSMVVSLSFMLTGREDPGWLLWLQNIAILPFFLIPISIGIAILRHRLYDIDVIINRALVYGSLTVTLTIAYVIAIAAIQVIARPFAGESQLAVAGSTLAVAALFQPARRRIQGFIDRRFYRSKFDATKTLEDFSARLRDEVNLETLSADLLAVVDETMRPAHRSLWLREAGRTQP
jgi:hypothetical protein